MARSRNIKPGICQNESLAELPYETRFLFAVLPCFADREGRMEDRPKRIKMQVFPADNIELDVHLQYLHDAGFILRYRVGESRYIQIVNFLKHQNPHVHEKPSEIPAPLETADSTVQAPCKHSSNPADSFIPITDSFQEQTPRKPQKRGSRLDSDWRPSDDLISWAMTERTDLDIQRVIDSFTDYWRAKPGQSGCKLDWDATFRNWVRNEQQRRVRERENPVQARERRNREALLRG